MFPPYDAPLTSGQRFILLVLTLFFPFLLLVYLVYIVAFMQGVLLVVAAAVAVQFLATLFVRS